MVRPVTSKRKLFSICKDQFKENEPDQIITVSESETFSTTKTNSSSLFTNKLLNSSKKSPVESSSRCERRREREGLSCSDRQKRCNTEDGGTTFTTGRAAMPMSERQQIALLMQLSSPSPNSKSDRSSLSSPQTPSTPHFGRGITKRNERGETPLHVAAIKDDCEKVAQLISQGANVNATDYAGWTALHEACNKGFLVVASLLIKGGADVNAKGLDNDTPLHDACVNTHYQIVRLLLRSGAKTNSINCRGKTPFDVCRSPRILSLLEEAKSGSLVFDSPEKDSSRIKLQELERIHFERDLTLTNTSPADLSLSLGMSRKTPPSNKVEEKPVAPSPIPSSIASSNTGVGGSQSSNGASLVGNPRPVSPRVTLRLPHVPRTPEKSQQRSHETKNAENEDVYEFRCTKEESKESDSEEKNEGGTAKPSEASSDPKGDKRPRENDPESDDEGKKRRRKEESKEANKNLGRGVVGGGRSSSSEKLLKAGQRSSSNGNTSSKHSISSTTGTSTSSNTTTSSIASAVTNTITSSSAGISDQRKSPSTVSSPKPSGNQKASPEKMDSDSEDTKSEVNSSGAPKVPPLKIVLAPCGGLSEQETSSINGKNGSARQLPYVVNSSSGTSEEKESNSSESKDITVKEEPNTGSCTSSSTVGTVCTTFTSNTTAIAVSSVGSITSTSASTSSGGGSSSHILNSSSSDKGSATRITRSHQRGGSGSGSSSSSNYGDDQVTVKTGIFLTVKSEPRSDDHMATDVIHPRKRKLKMKESESEPSSSTTVPEQPVNNCYEMFLKIRKQVERRRKLLFPVQPKPPQGFKDYLMNRCSYVLANSTNSQLSVPVIPAPASLTQALKDLFNEQEQERYKLRLQQLIEKEKLVLSVEQEILRVHGRAARALANQVLPFSVCTILKDEEVYNVISPEQEEKDRNARSRYNGRLFLSWLQDVDDKWEKIKEAMVLRHHNEAESLHAVQKMDWEWKLKEIGLIEPNSKTQIDELHVPMVQVADFDLLPA